MCEWGNDKIIHVIRRNNPYIPDGWHSMAVDACIADYVQQMNDLGIITLSCCCGHDKEHGSIIVAIESEGIMRLCGYSFNVFDNGALIHYIKAR